MNQPTFSEGVGVAIVTSLAGSVLYTALSAVFPGVPVLRLLRRASMSARRASSR